MSESEESLLKAISHYQNGLERYLQRQDEAKMLHNLGRLYKLPIKVCHLEKTGVGRTVNSLRKVEGEVGEAAKSLVARWKEMVVQEEENEAVDCSPQDESNDVPVHREESQSASHINTNADRKSGDSGKSSSGRHQSSKSKNHSRSSSHEKKHKEINKKRSHSSSEENTDDHEDIKNSSSDNSDDMKKNKIKQKERKSDVNSKNIHKSSRESKNKSKHSSEDDESEFDNHKSKKESKHESNDKKKHHHKSSHSCKEEISKNKIKDEKKHDSSKHDKEKKKDHKERESKDQREDKHKKSKHSDKTPKNELLSTSSSSSSSSNNNKKEKNDKNKLVKSAPYTAVINGIGSESGTSFEDALGMCGPPPSKKKKLSQHEKQKYSSPALDNEEENTKNLRMLITNLHKEVPGVLPLPKDPLENLDINISSLLPLITPHYRPLGLPVDDQPKKMLTDDEALSRVMMNKNQRTKVYSGNKVAYGKIPTLFDMCVRILQDNIDALEYTGGVPYSILKPILEKATANQLYMLEHHNPYLIDDSDELWKLHCQTEFRNKKKEEMETWRDMYMRCLDEREAKLKALTANIKQSQDKSLPVRTTKLAYVDSVAKPPRNIARKQAKNDTNSVRPSAKLATLATKGEAAKVSVPNPGARAAERTSSGASHPGKAKKAPLMAKTLTAYKNRFRR